MAIYFSEKFKNLRKTRNLTQEQIADIFHVSPQAVSRWETGATYPDIEILPALADFFSISVDDLLGVDIAVKEKRIEEIISRMCDAIHRQGVDENATDEQILILRNGLQEFPGNLYLTYRLAGALWEKAYELKDENKDEMKKYAEESIKIHERLVNENNNYTLMPILEQKYGCNYDTVRFGAIGGIAYTYHILGDTEKAVEWANKLPNINDVQNLTLSRILKGEERIKQIKKNIWEYSRDLKMELEHFEHNDSDVPEKIKRFKVAVAEIEEYARKGIS